VGFLARKQQRFSQVADDWNPFVYAVEHQAGIEACALAVDHGLDGKGLAMANQAMGRFAIEAREVLFAVNDGAGPLVGGERQN